MTSVMIGHAGASRRPASPTRIGDFVDCGSGYFNGHKTIVSIAGSAVGNRFNWMYYYTAP
jgi:hypothetical protein